MAAVLIDDDRVEIPEGWCVVLSGVIQRGDRRIVSSTRRGVYHFADAYDTELGEDTGDYLLVIRRDPKETP